MSIFSTTPIISKAPPTPSSSSPKICSLSKCAKTMEKAKKCSRCKIAIYCSKDCQKLDWKDHRLACKKIEKKVLASFEKSESKEKPESLIPGLTVINNFVSHGFHDYFVKEVNENANFIPINAKEQKAYKIVSPDVYAKKIKFNTLVINLIETVFSKATKEVTKKVFQENPKEMSLILLKYDKDGFIVPHIDAPEKSAGPVLIVSFGTPVVVNFYSEDGEEHKIFIPPRSMYSTRDLARNVFTHAIHSSETTYQGKSFTRGERMIALFTPPGPKSQAIAKFNLY